MTKRIPPRRNEFITRDGEMTLRFSEYLEGVGEDIDEITDETGVLDSLVALANRTRGIVTKLGQRIDDVEQMIFPSRTTTITVKEDQTTTELVSFNRILNNLSKISKRIDDIEALASTPAKKGLGLKGSTDNAIVKIDGSTGVQESGVILDDSNNITAVGSVDMTTTSTSQLNLPSSNDAVTPTMAFDDDSGWYESAADEVSLALNGALSLTFTAAGLTYSNAAGPVIANEASSKTNPTLIPDKTDMDTGIGRGAADELSLIAGNVEMINIDSTGGASTDSITLAPGATLRGSATSPLLAFGDGDTGFYEVNDDDLAISLGGTAYYQFLSTEFQCLSGSIQFPATQIPNADANALDDYEEGTWTPVLTDLSNNATLSVAAGFYVKTGQQVHVKCRVTSTSLGSVSGTIFITGLPFTSSATANSHGVMKVGLANGLAITSGNSVSGYVQANNTFFILQVWDSTGGNTPMQATEWSDDGSMMIDAIYYV